MPAVILTSDLLELTKVGLSEVYLNEIDEPTQNYSKLFAVEDSSKSIEEKIQMAGFGAIPEWNADLGPISWDEPLIGSRILFTHTDFALGWLVSHKMLREDLYGKTSRDLVAAAGLSTRHTIEQDCMNVYNNGFATNGPDGVPLFSASHPRLDGGVQSNLLTSAALSAYTLQLAIAQIRRAKNERGQPVTYSLDTMLVAPELEMTARKLMLPVAMETVMGSTTPAAVQLPNVLQGIVPNLISSPYLTDTTAYMIGAVPKQRHTIFYWREKPWYDADKDFATKGVANSIAFAYSVGYYNYKGWWGSDGA